MASSFKEKGHIWPLIIISLLLSSVAMMSAFVVVANSDGGAQVVESYYDTAVQWDSVFVVQNEIHARNWLPYLTLSESGGKLAVLDSNRVKVAVLSGNVVLSRPHLATPEMDLDIQFDPSDSSYVFPTGQLKSGLWDFNFELGDSGGPLEFRIRKDVAAHVMD
jgi:nitrogen fixation protein FixH